MSGRTQAEERALLLLTLHVNGEYTAARKELLGYGRKELADVLEQVLLRAATVVEASAEMLGADLQEFWQAAAVEMRPDDGAPH